MGQNVASETTEIYKRSLIDPIQKKIERRINKVIVREKLGIRDYEFRFSQIDTQDEKVDIEVAVPLFGMGGITPNELISYFGQKFNLKPSGNPAMDYHYIGGKAVETGAVLEAMNPNVPGVNPGSLPADDPSRGGNPGGAKPGGNAREQLRQWLESQQNLPREVRDVLQAQLDSERA